MSLVYWKGGGTNLRPTQIGSYFGAEFLGVGLLLGVASGAATINIGAITASAVAAMPYAGAGTSEIQAVGLDAVAAQPSISTATLTLGTVGLDAVGVGGEVADGTLTLASATLDATAQAGGAADIQIESTTLDAVAAALTASSSLEIGTASLDATAAALLANADIIIAPPEFAAAALSFLVPAATGALTLQRAAMAATAQMHAEGVGTLSIETALLATEVEQEEEPEPSTAFWTPREFGTTSWVTQ